MFLQPGRHVSVGFGVQVRAEIDVASVWRVLPIQRSRQLAQFPLPAAVVAHQDEVLETVDDHALDHRVIHG